ncbi:MAG: DUF5110 domain-containing protein [Bacilli bacterium]|nr:DUF5110 domain-containing protein [Bacilli bacterium]
MNNQIEPHFKENYQNAKSKPEVTFQGEKYRITVLTERLVRLEYNQNGTFFDDLTEQVINRNFDIPKFTVHQDDRYLEITTSYFRLRYQKEKTFDGLNIEIILLKENGEAAPNPWNPKSREVRNFQTSGYGIINLEKPDYQKGLYSMDGYVTLDDSQSLIVNTDGFLSQNTIPRKDIYVLTYRRDFGLCLKDYYSLTGYPPLIPRYALGIWWNKNEIYNFEEINKLVNQFHKHKIPLSVILLDEFWHLKDASDLTKYQTGYTFNRNLFSDPKYLCDFLHERGIAIGLNINPKEGFMPHEDHYQELANLLGIQDRRIIPFNVFDKTILNAYFQIFLRPLEELGIDFYELSYQDNYETLRALNQYHFKEANRKTEKRGFLLTRNAGISAHRYTGLYSGETLVSWDTLKFLPYFNSMASNKGLSWWSHDIGGYTNGMEEAELYMRYIQLGCFSPIFRLSSRGGRYYKREPWKWDIKTLTIVQEYCELRQRLIPYLYSEAYSYHKVGLPLVQPLYYNNPEVYDEPLYKNEYQFGKELLVAPITQKRNEIMNRTMERIFLPTGVWYDFKTGKKFTGNNRYTVFYKDEDYPVFARSGAIIPLANLSENRNDTSAPNSMEIHIFPGKSNIYELYEDDGKTNLYKQGYYLKSAIDYNYMQNNYTVIIRPIEGKSGIVPEIRDYTIRFRNCRKADQVIVHLDQDIIPSESYIEDNDFIVEVKNVKTTAQLTVNCKGKDIEIDAIRVINEDIDSIISDLQIKTALKEMLSNIVFSDMDYTRKRIEIKKLKNVGLDTGTIKQFIKLLEYVSEI